MLFLLLGRIVNPNATLAELFGLPCVESKPQQTITVNTSNLKSTAAAYLAQLPGFRLWLTDDFAAPSKIAAGSGRTGPGQRSRTYGHRRLPDAG